MRLLKQRRMFRTSAIEKIVLGIAFLILAVCGRSSVAQERLAVTTSIGHDVIVKGYAWVDGDCKMLQSPPIFVDRPPRHGTLCSIIAPARLDPPVVGGTGRCVGRQVNTIQIVYLPKTEYIGADDTHYIVKFPAADFGV